MSLLRKASIVTTPTAYENGKILSVKPSIVLGEELVVNGDFQNNVDSWSNGNSGVNTWVNGHLVCTGTGGSYAAAKQIIQAVANKKYLITGQIARVSGSFQVGIEVNDSNGSGWNIIGSKTTSSEFVTVSEIITTNTGTTQLDLRATIFNPSVNNTNSLKLNNVSVKEVLDADFQFTRNSSATRTNSQGLIEDMQILSGDLVSNGDFSQEGSELITNGNFATDSDWSKEVGWSIAVGSLIGDSVTTGLAFQSNIVEANKSYKASYDVVVTSGSIGLYFDGGTGYQGITTTTQSVTVFFKATTTSPLYFRSDTSNFTGSIDNVSVKEVGQDWDLGGDVTIGDDLAHFESNTNTYSYIRQDISSLASKTYKIQVEVKNYVSGQVQVGFSGSIANLNVTTNGIYTASVSPNSDNLLFEVSREFNGGNFNFDITSIKIIEITSDTNLPRIDYTGGVGHWLFEPQSTNLALHSEEFNNTYWGVNNTIVTPNVAISPSGLQDADSIVSNTTNYLHTIEPTDYTATISSSYTFSIYAKSNGSDFIQLFCSTGLNNVYQNYNITNGTLASGDLPTNYSADIIPYANDWYRIVLKIETTTIPRARVLISPILTDAPRNSSFVGDNVRGVYVWGFQKEQQSFATSYIPTEGSIKTRLQDAASGAGSSDLINSTEGVLYLNTSTLVNTQTIDNSITLTDGGNNKIIFRYRNTNGINVKVFVNGAAQAESNHTLSNATDFNKIAIKWKLNDYEIYVNGISVFTDNNALVFPSNSLNSLDLDDNTSTPFYGKTKCVAVFKEALNNDELECLTGEGYDSFNALALANNYTII